MYTTSEAAKKLGVTQRRILALIQSGDLVAERFGNSWAIDEASVEQRLSEPRLSGRPKLGQKRLINLKSYTLMNRNHSVFDFVYDYEHKRVSIEALHEIAWAPLGAGPVGKEPRADDFAEWLGRRYLPNLRPELQRLMKAAHVTSADALMFGSLGLNLSDQYWFKPIDVELDWHDINFFEHEYEVVPGKPFRTPDSSTPGALEKRWERIDGIDYLIKGSSTGEEREPHNEVLATDLMKRLLDESAYVPYKLVEYEGRTYSSCPTFATSKTEFIPAADVVVYAGITRGRDLYREYVKFCEGVGITDVRTNLSKMIVCDHVMANFDRHLGNFGLMRNVENLDEWRMAPLFDNGAGFFSRATLRELRLPRFTWTAHPFEEYPSQQLARIEDISWYDPLMLEGFSDHVAEALSANPLLPADFAEHAARHVQRNINAIDDIAAERNAVWSGF